MVDCGGVGEAPPHNKSSKGFPTVRVSAVVIERGPAYGYLGLSDGSTVFYSLRGWNQRNKYPRVRRGTHVLLAEVSDTSRSGNAWLAAFQKCSIKIWTAYRRPYL